MPSAIFIQRGLEVEMLELHLSSVQVKFHAYLEMSHKWLVWSSRRYLQEEWKILMKMSSSGVNTELGQGAYPSNKTPSLKEGVVLITV